MSTAAIYHGRSAQPGRTLIQPMLAGPANDVKLLTGQDLFFVGVTLVLAGLTYMKGVYEALGDVIIVFLSVFSFLNPFSAVTFLGASQNMPTPPRIPFTPAQLSVLGFSVYILATASFRQIAAGGLAVLAWLWPYLIWAHLFKDVVIRHDVMALKPQLLGYAAAVIAATYAPRVRGRFQLWLVAFGVGGLVGCAGWLFAKVGLAANVELKLAAERGQRLWIAGRTNEISICVCAGIGALLGAFAYAYTFLPPDRRSRRIIMILMVVSLGALVLGTLTTMATLARSGVAVVAATFLAWVAWVFYLQRQKTPGGKHRVSLIIPLFVMSLVIMSLPLIPGLGVDKQIRSIINASKNQMTQFGATSLTAGRSAEWMDAINFIKKHPIVGYMPGDKYEKHSFFEETTSLAHNCFLEAAKMYGILGFILYVIYFIGPTYTLVRMKGLNFAGPAILTFTPIFVLLNTLSHANHKTFHTYQGMVIGLLAGLATTEPAIRPWQSLQSFFKGRRHSRALSPARVVG